MPSEEHSLFCSSQFTATTLSLSFILPARSDHAETRARQISSVESTASELTRSQFLAAVLEQLVSRISESEERPLTGHTWKDSVSTFAIPHHEQNTHHGA